MNPKVLGLANWPKHLLLITHIRKQHDHRTLQQRHPSNCCQRLLWRQMRLSQLHLSRWHQKKCWCGARIRTGFQHRCRWDHGMRQGHLSLQIERAKRMELGCCGPKFSHRRKLIFWNPCGWGLSLHLSLRLMSSILLLSFLGTWSKKLKLSC